ncbi:MAG TPA: hypothetical protein VM425_08505 [Myxococcota bacterium]|nr:hypothetical protein [Myxococcota bacterium]
MHDRAIINLVEYWKHCHECGAMLVTVAGGSICPHCGFELEDPEDAARQAFSKACGLRDGEDGFWMEADVINRVA